ncbi:uncharacterized protein Tco_1052478 [Tanacetum coccineum]
MSNDGFREICNMSSQNANVLNDITNTSQSGRSIQRISQNTASRPGCGRRRLGASTRTNTVNGNPIRSRGDCDSAVNLSTSQTYPSSYSLSQLSESTISVADPFLDTQARDCVLSVTPQSSVSLSSSRSDVLDNGTLVNLSNVSSITHPNRTRPTRSSIRAMSSNRLSNSNISDVDTNTTRSVDSSFSRYWDCGVADHRCQHCQAVLWYKERSIKWYTPHSPKFAVCYGDGKVKVDYMCEPPVLLTALCNYNGGQCSKNFRKHIKLIYSLFAFTSTGGRINRDINDGHGPYTLRLNGHDHHRIRTLFPTHVDGQDVTLRLLVQQLTSMLEFNNVLVKAFRMAKEFAALIPGDGGPRYMIQQYHDAMAICRWARAPDLFVTMTCNPCWIVIARHVEDHIPGQHVNDMPNKRGLPHCHIIVFLHDEDKLSSPEKIDKFISAGLPSKDADPIGFEAVRSHMIHGPCGAYASDSSCMNNGECTKGFPKRYCESTYISPEGWPHYARPNNGREANVGSRNIMLDNRYVVPHNRDLLVKYDCHINVEWCNQGSLVKYLFSYITKGSDRSTVVIESGNNNSRTTYQSLLNNDNEIEEFLNCRYVSACEACWKIFNYDLHYRSIAVERLPFHEEKCNRVYFRDNDAPEVIAERISSSKTKFTEWMVANQKYPEGRCLTYVDYPTMFTWHDDIKAWKPRKSGKCIGRIYYVTPAMGEKFYLRMLLNIVRGARSHEEIRTVDRVVYPTYMATCKAYHLLGDDTEWIDTIRSGSQWQRGLQLIDLFVSILLFCDVADIGQFFTSSLPYLAPDVVHAQRCRLLNPHIVFTDEEIQNYTLLEIESVLNSGNRSLSDFLKLPHIDRLILNMAGNRLIAAERMYNIETEKNYLPSSARNGGVFFVYGCGGTRKTYLWRKIISRIRLTGKVVLSVSSSGIASLLLPRGRTSHSRFRIPIDLDKDSCCAIDVTSDLAELIKVAELIIWDEAPLRHRHAFEAVDRTFWDICKDHVRGGHNKVFGGKVVVLGGDFRQILPVVTNGTRFDVVTSAVNKSDIIWRNCRVYVLSINMRLRDPTLADSDVEQLRLFTNWLLDMGDCRLPAIALDGEDEATWITIPDDLLLLAS